MTDQTLADTSLKEIAAATERAARAAAPLAALGREARAALLEAIADAMDAETEDLTRLAVEETALGPDRLRGEVARTTGQLRLFADVLRDGDYLETIVDTADPSATPPRPDVRRMLHPLGPVAVYAASNFPFAFSVAGGDTASALAAGCPVIVKGHRGHPRLSARVADVVESALTGAGAPPGSFAYVAGRVAGERLVVDPAIKAASFTGSLEGGRALFDRASVERPDPIPFYGELGSINPVVVTAAAARERPQEIAEGLLGSFTLGVGQFCTKPGIVLVPAGSTVASSLAARLGSAVGGTMLTDSIRSSFDVNVSALVQVEGVEVIGRGTAEDGQVTPSAYSTTVGTLREHRETLTTECFGPACLLVHYADDGELDAALELLPGSLTVTVQGTDADLERWSELVPRWKELAGRVLWNGWPTGVAVNRAMQHGGPWPATTASLHTSVGGTAIRRFLRPVAYQDMPDPLLPDALRRDNPTGLLRRVNGELTTDPA